MAIIPSALYPAQTEVDADYPHGKARNAGTFQDGTGTPVEQRWLNDLWGFQQALLDAAAITPSGNPDKVGASQYLAALVQLALRVPSGATLTVDGGGHVALATGANINLATGANINLASGSDINVASAADINIAAGGDINVDGAINLDVGGHIDVNSGANINLASGSDINVASAADINIAAGGDINVDGAINLDVGGHIDLASGANINLATGANINLAFGSDINLATGSDINVASAADINVAAGGDVNVSGTVLIKTGGTLVVQNDGTLQVQAGGALIVDTADRIVIADAAEGYRLTLTPAFHDGIVPWARTTDASGLLGWYQTDVDARRSIWFALPVNPGDTVVDVYARLDGNASGAGHGGTPPASRPSVELVSVDLNGAVTVHASKDDDAVGAGYDASHDIVLQAGTETTGAMPHLATADPIYIRVRGEYGPGTAVPGLTILSISGNLIARSYRAANMVL